METQRAFGGPMMLHKIAAAETTMTAVQMGTKAGTERPILRAEASQAFSMCPTAL